MTAILGTETITAEQCRQYLNKINPNAPDIISFYKQYGELLGIRWGYAVAQMMIETGYLKYGGDVKPDQHNYAGLGTTGGGVAGASFSTAEQGVLAHLEHLFAYASTDPLPASLNKVDLRFDLVTRGIAQNWNDLNGRWAVPGVGYGEAIEALYAQMAKEVKGDVSMAKLVCIDPGHNSYGNDTGAEGNGLREQDLTLAIGLRLAPKLKAHGIDYVMTRTGDLVDGLSSGYSLVQSLQTRCDIANSANADLYVSVHINAGGGTGAEVLIAGSGGEAEKCAETVLPYLVSAGGWNNRGVKTENIYVLKHTNMPAILGETGFIDTANDAAKLAQDSYIEAIVEAYCQGICDYFGISYTVDATTSTVAAATIKEEETLDHAVLYFTVNDFSIAKIVADKLGGCAMFCRNANNANIHAAAKSAKHLAVIGGAEVTDHPNVTNCCGEHAEDTAILAAQYARTL